MAKTLDGLQRDESSNFDTNNYISTICCLYMNCMLIVYVSCVDFFMLYVEHTMIIYRSYDWKI